MQTQTGTCCEESDTGLQCPEQEALGTTAYQHFHNNNWLYVVAFQVNHVVTSSIKHVSCFRQCCLKTTEPYEDVPFIPNTKLLPVTDEAPHHQII